MGIGVIVHGFIEFPGRRWDESDRRVYRHNKRVIEHLPIDDDWPWLCQQMFHVMPMNVPGEPAALPQYQSGLITFAGEYKNMYVLETEWIRRFKARLLRKLCWHKARVFVDFGDLVYTWRADERALFEDYHQQPPKPPKKWSFSGLRYLNESEASDLPARNQEPDNPPTEESQRGWQRFWGER